MIKIANCVCRVIGKAQTTFNSSGSCRNEPWPDLELFVPMAISHAEELEHQLIQSLLFFWPRKHLRMVIVLDEESRDEELAAHLLSLMHLFARSHLEYNSPTGYYYRDLSAKEA